MNLIGGLPEAVAQTVNFPEANLAAAVRLALQLGPTDPIPQADLAGLTRLSVRLAEISDLTGLEQATGLTHLNLSFNQISDISALSGLTNLTELYLAGNEISDISALSGLTNLTELSLWINQISDISALSGLTNLRELDLGSNKISDISALSGLTNLRLLWLEKNEISDISALSGLTNLEELWLYDNEISDISALSGLTNLKIYFNGNDISDINPTSNLSKVRSTAAEALSTAAEARTVTVAARKAIIQCGLGWSPQSQYQHHGELPKVMIYALEFEYDTDRHGGYICKTIEIRTGDDSIENLAGWKLYLGILYNPVDVPVEIPEEHAQVSDRTLRLTPEMLGIPETFPCYTAYYLSQPLPSVHYVLKTDKNIVVDTAFSCFVWGQIATMKVNGINVQSPRRISSAALREMETPRLERYIFNNTSVDGTYMSLDEFTWDRFVFSDWLLASSEETEVAGGNAPSSPYKKLITSWAALKKNQKQ